MRQFFASQFGVLALAVLFFMITGCSTPYQKMGFRGGYEDTPIKGNLYYVNVQTNGFTSQITAVQYFHRRAKELCIENGYADYRIFNERDTSAAAAMYSANQYGGSGSTVNKPGFAGYVECLGKKK